MPSFQPEDNTSPATIRYLELKNFDNRICWMLFGFGRITLNLKTAPIRGTADTSMPRKTESDPQNTFMRLSRIPKPPQTPAAIV